MSDSTTMTILDGPIKTLKLPIGINQYLTIRAKMGSGRLEVPSAEDHPLAEELLKQIRAWDELMSQEHEAIWTQRLNGHPAAPGDLQDVPLGEPCVQPSSEKNSGRSPSSSSTESLPPLLESPPMPQYPPDQETVRKAWERFWCDLENIRGEAQIMLATKRNLMTKREVWFLEKITNLGFCPMVEQAHYDEAPDSKVVVKRELGSSRG